MQDAINYLACKAEAKMSFSDDEKEFMIELYEALWWGGNYHGYREAAKLARFYVHGDGSYQAISSELYKSSVIVHDVMIAMKAFVRSEVEKTNKVPTYLKNNNCLFERKNKRRVIFGKLRAFCELLTVFPVSGSMTPNEKELVRGM